MTRRHWIALVFLGVLSLPAGWMRPPESAAAARRRSETAQAAQDPNDPIARIKDEGLNRSQVMETLAYMTDVIGPRLTASPGMRRANDWTRERLASWGLQSAHLEAWGPFGRGWTLKRFSAQVVEPQCIPLIAFPKAWSPGNNGPLTAEVVHLDVKSEADLEKYRGKLRGAVVMISPPREAKPHFEARATRKTDRQLLDLADAGAPATGPPGPTRRFQPTPEQRARPAAAGTPALAGRKLQFAVAEGAALLVEPSRPGDDSSRPSDGGTIFVQSAAVPPPPGAAAQVGDAMRGGPSPWAKDAPRTAPQIVMAVEHYNRILRLLQHGERVKMIVDLAVEFQDSDPMGYNTVAEIPGSDLKDEVVMLGGHLDSWHAGTGATDNGAGCAVAMEVVRMLQALKLQPRRTVRIALWTGEEQGLLGSKAYVAQHFGRIEGDRPAGAGPPAAGAPPLRLVTKPGYEKLSVYFNLDNGTGKIRGVYLQRNEAVRPLFRQWLAPFREMGAQTLSTSNTGGTDHLSFDAIGLPGFQFIQDEVEYGTRTHHSNQDVFDRIIADDMKQASVIMASFVYNAAMLDQKLPRKPMPGR